MKTDRKRKTTENAPKAKPARSSRRATPKSKSTNGKNPQASYEHAPIGIVEASLEGKYINVNEEFCRMTGYDKKELLTIKSQDLHMKEDTPS